MSENAAIARLFRGPDITGARRLAESYEFRLEGIPETIRLWVYAGVDGNWFEMEQSHFLQAPGMDGPAVAETQRYASPEAAIRETLEAFLEGYRAAIDAGHTPGDHWLLPARN